MSRRVTRSAVTTRTGRKHEERQGEIVKRYGAIFAASAFLLTLLAGPVQAAGAPGQPWSVGGSGVPIPAGLFGGSSSTPGVPGGVGTPGTPGGVGTPGKLPGGGHVPGPVRTVGGYGKRIEVSLRSQRLTAFQNGRAVMSFAISTGRPGYRTPTGRFRIRAKGTRWWSHKWRVWMPYAMNFYSNYNLHSLPYSRPGRLIGENELGRPRSHGCIRIGPQNARSLFSWAPVGTPVWIH